MKTDAQTHAQTNCQQTTCCARLRSWLLKPSKMAFCCHRSTKPSHLGTSMVPQSLFSCIVVLGKYFLSHKVSHHGKLFPLSCAKAALPVLGNARWPGQPWGGKWEGFGRAGPHLPPKQLLNWFVQPLSDLSQSFGAAEMAKLEDGASATLPEMKDLEMQCHCHSPISFFIYLTCETKSYQVRWWARWHCHWCYRAGW